MKPFEQLTWSGKQRRFRRLALDALRHYSLDIQRVVLFSYDTNLLYRVRTVDGESYVLRLANGSWRSQRNAAGEVSWLDALAVETTIPARGSSALLMVRPLSPQRRRARRMAFMRC